MRKLRNEFLGKVKANVGAGLCIIFIFSCFFVTRLIYAWLKRLRLLYSPSLAECADSVMKF